MRGRGWFGIAACVATLVNEGVGMILGMGLGTVPFSLGLARGPKSVAAKFQE